MVLLFLWKTAEARNRLESQLRPVERRSEFVRMCFGQLVQYARLGFRPEVRYEFHCKHWDRSILPERNEQERLARFAEIGQVNLLSLRQY